MTRFWHSLVVALVISGPAEAFVEVRFGDGAPWDVFEISTTDCPISNATLVIDLQPSVAGVIVDTTYGGPGFQDPLPPDLFAGDAVLGPIPDGTQQILIMIGLLTSDMPIKLRLDVDDTIGTLNRSRISVATSEIAGATATLRAAGSSSTGTFDTTGRAALPLPANVPDCRALS